jgi:ATP-dependent DNA ligase
VPVASVAIVNRSRFSTALREGRNPTKLAEPFDHADWVFEAKFDGFRAAADTIHGRFDGELVVLDDAGRPLFNELLFARRRPTYVAFDLLIAEGIDLRPLPLEQRKARLARIAESSEGWIALTNGVIGEGRALYRAVVDADLEGIVAKRLSDPYRPRLTRWHKVLNRTYSQRRGRAEWFLKQRGRNAQLHP